MPGAVTRFKKDPELKPVILNSCGQARTEPEQGWL